MKRIIYILLLTTISLSGFAQRVTQTIGNKKTDIHAPGGFSSDSSLRPPLDTTASAPIGSLSFNLVGNITYQKQSDGFWHVLGPIALLNLYNSNGTLTGTRTVQQNNLALSFNGGASFNVTANTAGGTYGSMSIQPAEARMDYSTGFGVANMRLLNAGGYPKVTYNVQDFSGKASAFSVWIDSIQFQPFLGRFIIDTLETSTDTTNFKPIGHNPITGHTARMPYWLGTGSPYNLANVHVTNFDTTLFFPAYNTTLIKGKAVKMTDFNSITWTKVITDSTREYKAQLVGDVASPGNSMLYGTNVSGAKGWYTQPILGSNVSVGNAAEATFHDSTLWWKNDTTLLGRKYEFISADNKLGITYPAGSRNTDSTSSLLFTVNPANILLSSLGGSLNLSQIAQGSATTGQVPMWNGSNWVPSSVSGSGSETDPISIHNQRAAQSSSFFNVNTGTFRDSAFFKGGGYIANYDAAGVNSTWFVFPNGVSGIGQNGTGVDVWIAHAQFGGQFFPDAGADDIAYRNTSHNLLFGTGSGSNNSIFQIQHSTQTARFTKAATTIITDTTAGKPLVVNSSGQVIGRGYWYGPSGGGGGGSTPTLQQVSDAGSSTTTAITVQGMQLSTSSITNTTAAVINLIGNNAGGVTLSFASTHKATIGQGLLTADRGYDLPDATGTFALTNQTMPTGGTTGQVLAKIDGTNYNTQWVTPSGGGGGGLSGLTTNNVPYATSSTTIGPSGSASPNGIYWDNTNNRLLINKTSGSANLDINGNIIASSAITTGANLVVQTNIGQGGVYTQGTGSSPDFEYKISWAGSGAFKWYVADGTVRGMYLKSDKTLTLDGYTGTGTRLATFDASGVFGRSSIDPAAVVTTSASHAVSNAMMAQMAAHTFKGNNTGSTADPADITTTQLTADLNIFTSTLQGLVPASGGGTVNFLRADGVFAAPPGGGGTTVATGLTAAGTNQSTALALSGNNSVQEVTTTASGTGVKLPTASATSRVLVVNRGANDLVVYPATSGVINGQSANTGFTVQAGSTATFVGKDVTSWYTEQAFRGLDVSNTDGNKGLVINANAVTTSKINDGAVTLAKMANLGNQLIIGRNTSGTGVPEAISISQAIDWLGSTQGSVIYRNATGWVVLAPGTNGQVLTSGGASANVSWTTVSGGGGMSNPMTTLGDLIYEDATPTAVRLAGNTTSTKKFLTQTGTGSVSAAPGWNTLVAGDIPDISASYIKNTSTVQSSSSIYTSGAIKTDNSFTSTATTAINFSTVGWAGYGANSVYFVANSTTLGDGIKMWINGGGDLGFFLNKDKSLQIPGVGLAADGTKIIAADAAGKLIRQTIDPANIVTTSSSNVVTNSMLAQIAAHSYRGNNTGSTANVADITAAQLTADLSVFVASGASHAKGLVPDPGATAGTTKYLREDGTWVAPPGSITAASNVGSGVGVWYDINGGNTFRFKSLTTPTDGGITIADNGSAGIDLSNSGYDRYGKNRVTTSSTSVFTGKYFNPLPADCAGTITVEITGQKATGESFSTIRQINFKKVSSTCTLGTETILKANESLGSFTAPTIAWSISANHPELDITPPSSSTIYWNTTYKISLVINNL